MTREQVQVNFESYSELLYSFLSSVNMDRIMEVLKSEKQAGSEVLPNPATNTFRAFRETPLNDVRVVILGMDPYPNPNYVTGLAFSTPNEARPLPPSLEMIFNCIEQRSFNGVNLKTGSSVMEPIPDLTRWTKQGVMLLNSALTIGSKDGKFLSGSHLELWKPFIEHFLKSVATVKRKLIFVGWGEYAKDLIHKNVDIFGNEHFVLLEEHPIAAKRAQRMWECDHFDKINAIISANNLGGKITW